MSNNFGVAAQLADFDKRHGGWESAMQHNGVVWFPDGAWREMSQPYGRLMDVPTDDYERLRNIAIYHEARLAAAVAAHKELFAQLWNSGQPNETGLRELKNLKKIVDQRTAALKTAQGHLAGTDHEKRYAERERAKAEQAQQRAEWQSRLNDLYI